MPNEIISQLNGGVALATPADGDLIPITDVSDTTEAASGTTKPIAVQSLYAKKIKESSGPTELNVGAISNGQFLKRSGTDVIGVAPASTDITDFAEAVEDKIGAKVVAGSGISVSYNDTTGETTVTNTASGGAGGFGDVVGPSSSVDAEIALFNSTTGKVIKRATTSGVLKGTSGVIGQSDANDLSSPVYAADGGGSDAYAITLSPAPSAYQTGAHYRFKANTANTGAATLNVNSLGAKTIKKVAGGITTDLSDNDIRSGQFVDVVYDGTNFQMQSTLGNAASGGSTNPTSDTLPYNNAGSFADSPIARLDAATVRAEVFHAAGTTDVNTNGVISGRGTGLVVGRDLQFGLQNGSGTLDALLSKPNTRHSGLLSVRRDTSGNGATFAYPPDSPAQITANQNDYSLGTNRSKYIRLTSNGVWDVTGLTIPSDGLGNTQVAGQEHVLVNVGANGIILKNQSASSSAANRFLCSTGADITLNANEAADIFYDATTQRWRVFKR